VTGIIGSIFSDLLQVDADRLMLKTGMNVSLFGMLGCGLGYMVINWPSLRVIGWIFKFKISVNLIFGVLFLLMFANEATNMDITGYIGGFLAGVFICGMLPSIKNEQR
jgi:hypothetical protein